MTDTGSSRSGNWEWTIDALIGAKVYNLTDETDYTAFGTISDNDETTITTGTMAASSEWNTNDIYYIGGSSSNTALPGAIQEIKFAQNKKNSNFFESYLLLTLDSIKKKDYEKCIKWEN